jgi:pimeloyl-ACP methyl ester carboxylesterase
VRLIFLHAFPLDGRMWDGQRSLDLGSGPVRCPSLYAGGHRMADWARVVLDDHDNHDDPLVVVGLSMGGSCALEMARQAPDRIAALVLVGSKAGVRHDPVARDHYIARLRAGGVAALWDEMVPGLFTDRTDPGVVDTVKSIAGDQDTGDLIRAVRAFHDRDDLSPVVASWPKPLLVIGGDEDGYVSVEKSTGIARSAPHGRLHIHRRCGHFPNLEQPDEFNAVLTDLLESVG